MVHENVQKAFGPRSIQAYITTTIKNLCSSIKVIFIISVPLLQNFWLQNAEVAVYGKEERKEGPCWFFVLEAFFKEILFNSIKRCIELTKVIFRLSLNCTVGCVGVGYGSLQSMQNVNTRKARQKTEIHKNKEITLLQVLQILVHF